MKDVRVLDIVSANNTMITMIQKNRWEWMCFISFAPSSLKNPWYICQEVKCSWIHGLFSWLVVIHSLLISYPHHPFASIERSEAFDLVVDDPTPSESVPVACSHWLMISVVSYHLFRISHVNKTCVHIHRRQAYLCVLKTKVSIREHRSV